jgi:hypothetical protein
MAMLREFSAFAHWRDKELTDTPVLWWPYQQLLVYVLYISPDLSLRSFFPSRLASLLSRRVGRFAIRC